MSHTLQDKNKLLNRVRRIRGQAEAVEKALLEGKDAYLILQTIAACRGAINGLMAEVIEGHIRLHIIDPNSKSTVDQMEAAEELINIIKSYLK